MRADKEKEMRFIIFGPPGAGKGTYASQLGSRLKIAKISTGDIFREEIKQGTNLGGMVAAFLNKGELVPDEIVIQVLEKRIREQDTKNGFILDGYPRTIPQAKALDNITKINAIIRLIVPEWVIVERLSSRRTCKSCGAIYNVRFLEPRKAGVCDLCGGELYQREDDKPEVIRERLRVHEAQTKPLIKYYRGRIPFVDIMCRSAGVPPEIVVERILQKMQKMNLVDLAKL